jgi:predicted signal transduction protein with EAL and GGDEF domain
MKAESRFMWLALATSGSTLICCALPALLVSLGAGAVLASLVSAVPALIWVSVNKPLVFTLAATMLAIGGWMQSRPASCPADPQLARACAKYKRISKTIYWSSVGLYVIGVFFAFIAPRILY